MTVKVHLDGDLITTEAEFHTVFREATGVEWYGGNLDALFDLLVGVVPDPIDIVFVNAAKSRAGIGERFDKLLTVIFDAIDYRGDGTITFKLEA